MERKSDGIAGIAVRRDSGTGKKERENFSHKLNNFKEIANSEASNIRSFFSESVQGERI